MTFVYKLSVVSRVVSRAVPFCNRFAVPEVGVYVPFL